MKKKAFQNKNLKFFRDLNLIYQPKSINFSTEIYRDYEESMMRNKGTALVITRPTFFKQFTWQRNYGINYDLTSNLQLQYTANANARIDEPIGPLGAEGANDSIWHSIMGGGTMQNFQQTLSATWNPPINKLPYLEFLRVPITYRTTYNYLGTTQALADQGSTLSNSMTLQANANANMQTLYNKIPLLRNAHSSGNKNQSKSNVRGNPKAAKKSKILTSQDSIALADSLKHESLLAKLRAIRDFSLRLVTCLNTANVQYSLTTGSRLPGYMGEATIIGLDPTNLWTPGVNYLLGIRTGETAEYLLRNDLLSRDTLFNDAHENTINKILSLQATLEPLRDLKIDVTCTQNYSSREQYYYKYLSEWDRVDGPLSAITTGSYTTTVWSLGTAFIDKEELYQQFLDNRAIIANRLAEMNPDPYCHGMVQDTMLGEYYPAGYSPNSQTVLLSSFLATYLGKDPNSSSFSPFLKFPLPNWSVNYTGLNKIQFLKKWFTNITLTHKYQSTYTVANYYTDAAISGAENYDYGIENIINNTGDYIAPLSTDAIQIAEQFNPLIRIAVSMVNSLQFNFSLQRNRTLALSFSNNQLTETSRDGITFGGGYRFKDVAFNIKAGGKTHNLKSDIVLQLNLTYNSNKTEIRKINQSISQVSSGSQVWIAEISGEYDLSSTLSLRVFFQTNINTPYISNAYPNSTTKGGISIRFSF